MSFIISQVNECARRSVAAALEHVTKNLLKVAQIDVLAARIGAPHPAERRRPCHAGNNRIK